MARQWSWSASRAEILLLISRQFLNCMGTKRISSILPWLLILATSACHDMPSDSKMEEIPTSLTPMASLQIPNATITYYDIQGSKIAELRAQLDLLGPVDYDGYKSDATTKWFIFWNWPGYGNRDCHLSQATISYEIEVILPRWNPPENIEAEVIDRWAAYIQALVEHENGHVEYVVNHSSAVLDAIKSATCETAELAANGVLRSIRQHDIEYDMATEHGRTQGARFP